MQWYYRNEAMYRDSGSIPLTTTIVPCNFTLDTQFSARDCGPKSATKIAPLRATA